MSSWQNHPGEVALVRLLDGELPAAEAREIQRHVEGCAACRGELAGLQATVADCHLYREEVLEPLLPPPPAPWADLHSGFARIDRELTEAGERARWWRAPVLRWGLAAAAAVALTVGVLHQLRETPSVEAATLLQKAQAAAAVRPVVRHRILLRTKSLQLTRLAGVAGTLPHEPASPALEALFREARWDWNDPLSARAFAGWRDAVPEKHDTIDSSADRIQIRTTTPDGPLAAASLTLRSGDLSPIEGRLEFRDRDWVEMTEMPDAPAQSEGTAAAAPRAAVPSAGTEPAGGTPSVPQSALISSELHALLKLHELKADLGDPVEVTATGDRVLVSGRPGLSPQRQLEIQTAMQAIPYVTVQFADAAQAPTATEPPPAAAPSDSAPPNGIAARVERQLGGRPQFERFNSQMLDSTEEAMPQAYALRRLANRFPPDRESLLDAADRRALRAAAREEAKALESVGGRMSRILDPVLSGLGGQTSTGGPTADTWQAAAEDLLQNAQRVDKNLSMMLGAAAADGTAFSASGLMSDLSRVVADSAACQRLLQQE